MKGRYIIVLILAIIAIVLSLLGLLLRATSTQPATDSQIAGVCPPNSDYRILNTANIDIAGETAAMISYNDRRVTVTSNLGTWTSDPLPVGPVGFTMNLALQDGRQYNMAFEGVVCSDGTLYMMPPTITPLSSGQTSQDIKFPDPCTLSVVTCPEKTATP